MKANIIEIFKSIQGEGKYLGFPTVFVRFGGCDVNCSWCDTDRLAKEETDTAEIIRRIEALYESGVHVSLTGGEPLLQVKAIGEVASSLKERNMKVYLETNGIRYKEFEAVKGNIDIVSMDFKLPSSTGCRAFWAEHREMLALTRGKDVFVKIVVTTGTSRDEAAFAVKMIAGVDPNIPLYFQPETSQLKTGALEQCLKFQEYALEFLPDVRVIPQVHRLIGVR
ncbi:MAG: 7-carboxy-7-deazaguanine synthase QueE [Candidatus Omnitrophota bacterium]